MLLIIHKTLNCPSVAFFFLQSWHFLFQYVDSLSSFTLHLILGFKFFSHAQSFLNIAFKMLVFYLSTFFLILLFLRCFSFFTNQDWKISSLIRFLVLKSVIKINQSKLDRTTRWIWHFQFAFQLSKIEDT